MNGPLKNDKSRQILPKSRNLAQPTNGSRSLRFCVCWSHICYYIKSQHFYASASNFKMLVSASRRVSDLPFSTPISCSTSWSDHVLVHLLAFFDFLPKRLMFPQIIPSTQLDTPCLQQSRKKKTRYDCLCFEKYVTRAPCKRAQFCIISTDHLELCEKAKNPRGFCTKHCPRIPGMCSVNKEYRCAKEEHSCCQCKPLGGCE